MVKITKSQKQFKVTIPQEIITLTKWNEDTEIIFVPMLKEPNSKLDKDTPLVIRKVN